MAGQFLAAVLSQARVKALLSSDHFSVKPAPGQAGGTLLEARASLKSFRPKDGSGEPPGPGRNGERDFHGKPRSNDSTPRPPTPTPVSIVKGWARRPGSVSSAMP